MLAPGWQGEPRGAELRFTVGPGELGVLVIPRNGAGAPSRAARLTVLAGREDVGLAATLARLPPAIWVASSGIGAELVAQLRLVGGRGEVEAGRAWLSGSGLAEGRAVVLADPQEPVFVDPRSGKLRVRAEARVEVVEPRTVASAAADAPATRGGDTAVPGGRHRVLIVDDSRTMRELLAKIIAQDPALEVVGSVGEPAMVEQALAELRPDVVTLDIHMGEISGVDVVRALFPRHRIPFVMISSASLSDGSYVVDALLAGAVDYIQKPAMRDIATVAPLICEKLREAATARAAIRAPAARRPLTALRPLDMDFVIAIGASTGGVEALREVLTGLPEQIPPVVIVQHIPAVFSRAFADRMDSLCPFSVKEGADGDLLGPGRAFIAPGGLQMGVLHGERGLRLRVVDAPAVGRHKPAVDYLFNSIVALKRPKVAAAVLTGMGDDGARGLQALRHGGARTLAQDEASSIVYGMPREAAKLGGAEKVVPLGRVAETLLQFCQRR